MNKIFIFCVASTILTLSGCSSKKYFDPDKSYSISDAKSSFKGKIIYTNRHGATFKSGQYLTKSGDGILNLGEGYRYINSTEKYIIASNQSGNLKLIDKNSKETLRVIGLQIPIVTATVHNDLIVYLLEDNSFGVYRISNNLKVLESKSERVFAIDRRVANPIFNNNRVILPTLDGKILIFNPKDKDSIRTIYISSQDKFNGAIYLSKIGNKIITASAHAVMVIENGIEKRFRIELSEILVEDKKIYIFTKYGDIIKTDLDLNKVATKNFQYIHYSLVGSYNHKIYALDYKGSLVVIDNSLTKSKVYSFDDVDTNSFISGDKLFKKSKVINLDRLNYE